MNNTKIIPVGSKVLIKQDEVPEYYGNTKILISGTQEKENKGKLSVKRRQTTAA